MDITIESVDASAMEPLGFTQLPSYPVRFSSAMVSGVARFVPLGDDVRKYLGQTVCVEPAQERVTGFERVAPGHCKGAMVALDERGSFQIVGRIGSVSSVAEPPGASVVTVEAGVAAFFLTNADFEGFFLQEGDAVTFRVHGLSLWNEEI